ncbi:DUF58 domain-containing protein [Roseisolibacter sp. H3M3-2]|uniref:DUF58 domain-containing protein n=1 Tax=Roseisolibacter sp. H3M3-2 TaxID=3031323 RepID=UPI0023D9F92D|nr:DUF58 domain-containing protein [Roseisolibacter sp. H3M3-2]MDF1503227.1 DUF58 domain-containing protein [Roseisolibacter sp. H3M3-2]
MSAHAAGSTLPARAVDRTDRPAWHATSTFAVAIALGLVIAGVGVLTSRVDVVLLALPLLLSTALGLDRRPPAGAPCALRVDVARRAGAEDAEGAEGDERDRGASAFAYRVTIEAPAGAELVHLRLTTQGAQRHDLVLAARPRAEATGSIPVLHSGPQRVVEVGYRLVGVDGGWRSTPAPWDVVERVVEPALAPVASIPLPHRLTGLAGVHGSARRGDGGEFRDVHPYAPGDRLRRIDFKATARRSQGTGALYVRRTDATSDATVVLVIDGREDVGERVESWSAPRIGGGGLGSMDLAREAAASLAAAAIGAGDRVGLIDLAAPDGVIAAGSGRRHLDRLLRRIAVSGASGTRLALRRAPVVPPGAIVYLLSPFLDDDVAAIAALWRAAGHRVVGVDLLPTPWLDGSAPYTRLAHRVVLAERRRRVADVRANGVELFRWQEDAERPSRAVALRTLARAGRRRR